jgi:tRNA pseudouridine55 synthase
LPIDSLVAHLPAVSLDDASAAALCQGRHPELQGAPAGLVRVYDRTQRFIGIAKSDMHQLIPQRLVATNVATPAADPKKKPQAVCSAAAFLFSAALQPNRPVM